MVIILYLRYIQNGAPKLLLMAQSLKHLQSESAYGAVITDLRVQGRWSSENRRQTPIWRRSRSCRGRWSTTVWSRRESRPAATERCRPWREARMSCVAADRRSAPRTASDVNRQSRNTRRYRCSSYWTPADMLLDTLQLTFDNFLHVFSRLGYSLSCVYCKGKGSGFI